jgi:hypothetical protein
MICLVLPSRNLIHGLKVHRGRPGRFGDQHANSLLPHGRPQQTGGNIGPKTHPSAAHLREPGLPLRVTGHFPVDEGRLTTKFFRLSNVPSALRGPVEYALRNVKRRARLAQPPRILLQLLQT